MLLYLINPRNPLVSVVKSKQNRWNRYSIWKPLGLLVIAGLTPQEWKIVIVDENVKQPDYAVMPIPDLVGITAFTSQADRAYGIAKQFRARGVPVVMGGIHATMCPGEATQWVDSVVTGEAESVWAEVIEDRKKGQLKPLYSGERIGLENVPVARNDLLKSDYKFGSIQTTRGCPLSCNFCSVTAFNGRRYRHRPISHILEEFRTIREKLVLIVDDNFIGTRQDHISHTKEFLREIINSGVSKKWVAQVTLNFGEDEELLALAARAGCIGVFIGFESISSNGLKEIHKKFNIRSVHAIQASVRNIQQHGISVVGSFIIGLDVDKKHIGKAIAKTAQLYKLDTLNVMFLTPLPGTRLWDEMNSTGRIILNNFPHDWKYYTLIFPVARYNHLGWSEMLAEKEACYRYFYAHIRILQRVFYSICQLRNPMVTFLSNLWYRRNTLKLDHEAYENFDLAPGAVPLQLHKLLQRAEASGQKTDP